MTRDEELARVAPELSAADAEHEVAKRLLRDQFESVVEDPGSLRSLYDVLWRHDEFGSLVAAIDRLWRAERRHTEMSQQVVDVLTGRRPQK